MRNLFLFMMVTVDGYFEGENHDISWHNAANTEFSDFAHAQLDGVADLIVMGKRTFELMESFWPKPEGMEADPATARYMTETPKIVASHTPFTSDWKNTTVVSVDFEGEIARLKEQPGKDMAILGSNNLCVSLMEKGLVDEFRLMFNPVALGKGTQLFKGLSKRIDLKLNKTREFESGNVLNYYSVK